MTERKEEMPKVNRRYSPYKAPPIDWLWAAVLERTKVYGYDLKTMAQIAGVEYGHMRQLWRVSPWEWKKDVRDRVCHHFGINISVSPNTLEVNIQ